MLLLLKLLILIFSIFVALGIACAITLVRQGKGVGRSPVPVDPYFHPFGEVPGFTREQLEAIARRPVQQHHAFAGPATPADPAGGGIAFLSDVAVGSSDSRPRDVR